MPSRRCLIIKPRFIQLSNLTEIMFFTDQPQGPLTFIKHNPGTHLHHPSYWHPVRMQRHIFLFYSDRWNSRLLANIKSVKTYRQFSSPVSFRTVQQQAWHGWAFAKVWMRTSTYVRNLWFLSSFNVSSHLSLQAPQRPITTFKRRRQEPVSIQKSKRGM